ncbi:MAG: hypothetical protein WAM11_01555 [Cyanobium sp.]
MASSCTVQACLPSRRDHSPTYAPPEPLKHLHVLDLLELNGSQHKAARALAMHQSTVCRSAALMSEQFMLQPRRGASVCRYGSNESLRLLRLAYRAHRLMGGQLRIATDPLHQPLLAGMVSGHEVPPQCRPSREWAQLLSQALIDGAIVSSWCHPRLLVGECLPSWSGLITVPLGTLGLQLVSHQTATADDSTLRKVLLPRRNVTPLLHEALAWHGFQVEQQPISSQDVPSWLKRMRDRQLAIPLCPGLVDPGWIQSQNLVPHPDQPHLIEQLWLMLPQGLVGSSREARHLIRTLRQRVEQAGEARLGEVPITTS